MKGRTKKGFAPQTNANPFLDGAEGQNRTADTGIFSPLLYRLSYLGTTIFFTFSV